MTEYILLGIVLLALATLYAGLKKRSDVVFYKICDAYLVFVSVHALYALIVRHVFGFTSAIDMAAPFALGYGPFFYIGIKSLDGRFLKKDIYLHFAPFLVFTLLYLLLVINPDFWENYLMSFYILLYSLVAISLLGYTFWGLLLYPGLNEGIYTKEKKQLIKTCSYSLVAMAVLFAVVVFSGHVSVDAIKSEVSALVVYLGIFISVVLAYIFRINNIADLILNPIVAADKEMNRAEPLTEEKSVEEIKVIGSVPVQKYNKSALSPVVLDDYRDKLDKFINIEKVYLDNELTLEGLAKKMRIPMHHLTQLFNVYLGENFNQYINRFRVDYACQLLLDNDGSLSIEQIAFNSGFNSKVSFNRHFKNITGQSPKEYVYGSKSTDE